MDEAWWLRLAKRDPSGTPEMSYWIRRYTSTAEAASPSSTQATSMKNRAMTEYMDSSTSRWPCFLDVIRAGARSRV